MSGMQNGAKSEKRRVKRLSAEIAAKARTDTEKCGESSIHGQLLKVQLENWQRHRELRSYVSTGDVRVVASCLRLRLR